MKVKVESQSDSKGQESPTRFTLGTRIIQVEACVDRWHGEQACYFRVLGSDENSYILKGPLEDGSWELVSFTHKDSRVGIRRQKGAAVKHLPSFLVVLFWSRILSKSRANWYFWR